MASEHWTVGSYLARRLQEAGISDYFAVPGDYNLVLLDELLSNPDLRMISCCNELNAGYAADGYARATGGPSAAVVTFSVGGLSLLNAVAGAYAEDLPMIAISGGPNTNSEAEWEYLHHTLGEVDYGYQREIFDRVTAEAVRIHHPSLAPVAIDRAIDTAMLRRKPVYIEIASNIANAPTSAPISRSFARQVTSDPSSLAAAVDHAATVLNAAARPILIAGSKTRAARAEPALRALADACGYAQAAMPNAKSFLSEAHENYMGIYWGPVSTPGCGEIVDAADALLFAGPVFTDYTTTGHQLGFDRSKAVIAHPISVQLGETRYSNVRMDEFLEALSGRLAPNDGAVKAFERVRTPRHVPAPGATETPLTVRQLFARIESLLRVDSTLLVETGDSWFNGIDVALPDGARFEIQMQYGSIGWSVGATLGYALGKSDGRLISCIGDGSFQLTAQEISTMIRYDANPIIFLINNGGYTIEVEIHDGPYNTIKNWDYSRLIEVFGAGEGKAWNTRATTEGELDEAIAEAQGRDGLCFIEVAIDRDDCNVNLLRWGNQVARNNGRPNRCR
ncbi:thiamine pyrophosphate-binding protein [Ruegeria sp. 2205SS24-7]|uniref:thiamine pyrophosphate-binding protein n=1 Tax=Ruegeria discodermiae TaxID=3064389 RepID=UPI00274125CA|nr:thiamine pyrophosphate-binding protein [Ruegeria sp. 2205SS24-7]MDP5217249.1 thiamine pyrophosphate-binding protein [Ruegeria sp. 2205SS24-7]